MRAFIAIVFLGLTLWGAASLEHTRISAFALAVASISAGVLASCIVSSSVAPLEVACGAVGALVAAWLAPTTPLIAGAALVTAVFAARGIRASTARARAVHTALSIAGGLAASLCASSYATSTPAAQIAAVVVSGVLASAALLVPVEDPLAFSLGLATEAVTGGARVSLARATHLARLSTEIDPALPRPVRRRVRRSLQAVLTLGASQSIANSSAREIVERQMAAHVTGVERLIQVAIEASAREAGLNDKALVELRDRGDEIAAQVSALAEVDEVLSPMDRER